MLQPEIHAFPKKSTLKKSITTPFTNKRLMPYFAAAAAIVVLVLLYPVFKAPSPETVSEQTSRSPGQPEKMEKLPSKNIQAIENDQPHTRIKSDNRPSKPVNKESAVKASTSRPVTTDPWEPIANRAPQPIANHWKPGPYSSRVTDASSAASIQQSPDVLTLEAIKDHLQAEKEKQKFSLWKVADAGLKGLSILSENDFSLKPARNEQGEVESITFSTENYSIKAPVRSPETDVTK